MPCLVEIGAGVVENKNAQFYDNDNGQRKIFDQKSSFELSAQGHGCVFIDVVYKF